MATIVTAVGASVTAYAADDAEAEVVEARAATQATRTDLREVRAQSRAARADLRVLRGLLAPGMADTLQVAYLTVAAEVCATDDPDAPAAFQQVVEATTGRLAGLEGHEGWEAALDPAEVTERCTGD